MPHLAMAAAPSQTPSVLAGSANNADHEHFSWPLARRWLCARHRSLRVGLLLLAVALMSVGDLALTLTFITSVGMIELNPIARWVMHLESPHAVAIWKVALILLNVGLLFYFRKRRLAEVASWACFLVMAFVSIRWLWFAMSVASMAHDYQVLMTGSDQRFVVMASE
jgi:hypothetical protein